MIVTSVPIQQQQKFKTWMYVPGENWKVTLLFEHPSYYRTVASRGWEALGACDLCSYKQYFDGRIFRPENYRGHSFSRASDLLLILHLLDHHRCKELLIISWFFHLCSVIPYYFVRLRKLREEIADALRIYCKTKVRFSEYFEYLSMEWKSEKSTTWTMIRELIRYND